ncbi:SpoIIE family protein phosphatase [Streptomyces sp. NA02950]|uniref:SpoIIE family protein phosphatase n=1 Tax=Streptomyces sp. NA02950 TaxID=2742137 RepID=UPI0020CAF79B|nr:SpoIIE family protein phosphatase [Streptomyces sp. NA02950]
MMIDAAGEVVVWSEAATRLLGHSPAQAVGGPVTELLEGAPPWSADRQEWHGRLALRHREGHRLTCRVRVHRLAGGDHAPLWLLTAEPSAGEAPFPGGESLSDWLLTSSPVALAVYDTDLRFVRQNPAMEHIVGIRGEHRVGRGLSAAVTGPGSAEWEARMRRALETGRADEGYVLQGRTRADPDHDHFFAMSASPLRDREGRIVGLCATSRDVTEQHRGRERLALLNEASTRIGSTLDVMRTGQELAELVVPRLADFVSVNLLESLLRGEEPPPGPVTGAVLRRVANQSVREGAPEAVSEVGEVAFYSARSPHARALATSRSELHRVMDHELRSWATQEDPERFAKAMQYGFHSWLVVPVIARGTTLGVVDFVRSATAEAFDTEDLSLAEELVARAAVCLDNARRYTHERASALALQRSLLPRRLPEQSAAEVASRYLPAAARSGIGGDWFDVIPLSGARVALVVGDVVGHGLQASATMGRLRTALRTLAEVDLTPEELLTQLDDLVARRDDAPELEADEATAGDFGATCLYAVYDPVSGRCSLARAGHPAPAVVPPDGPATFLDLPAGPPLGLGGLPFEALEAELPEGSLLAIYTDGLVESRSRGMDAGLDTLRHALTLPAEGLDTLCDQVVDTMLPDRIGDDAALLLARLRRLDADRVVAWEVPADPAAVAEVRADAVRWLTERDLAETAVVSELVVSELVTNAIRYGTAPIRLRLILDRALICEVSDASSTVPHARRARVLDEGGRGLLLVAQLTQRWGTRHTPTGKVIWCEQPLPAP